MKRLAFVAMLLAARFGHAQVQPIPQPQTIFFAPDAARTVTMSKGALPLGSISVPQGSLLAVEYVSEQPAAPDSSGRFEAHGHVVVRINLGGHFDQMGRLETRMANAPVVLTGDGVDVVVSRRDRQ